MDQQQINYGGMADLGAVPLQQTQPTQQAPSPEFDLSVLGATPLNAESSQPAQIPELPESELWKGRFEAAAKGLVSRPVVAAAQKYFGVTPEEAALREKGLGKEAAAIEFGAMALPAIFTLGESALLKAGFTGLASGVAKVATLGEFTQAGLLSKAGQAAAKGLGVKGATATLATAMGVENALFAAADETAKAIEGNPNTVSQAVWNVGLSGLTGVGLGAAVGKTGELWKTKYGPQYKSFINDFTSRWKDVTKGDLPAAGAVADELQKVITLADESTNQVFGVTGLKRQELKSLLPDIASTEAKEAFNKAVYDTDKFFKTIQKDPDTFYLPSSAKKQIKAASNNLLDVMVNPGSTGAEMFSAIDDFKKIVGSHSKFERGMPVAQEQGSALTKKLFGSLMSNLENESAWGMAAKRQNEINKASSKFFQSTKPFQTLVTSIGPDGKRFVDPAKLETLINQAKKGSARGVVKQERLEYFLDVVDDLYDTIEKIDTRLGTKVLSERPTMTASRAVTEKLTPGMKAADMLYGRAIDMASEAGGMALGYKLGKGVGFPFAEYLGAAFGHYQLKPLLKTVLPAVVKPMLAAETVAAGGVRAAGQVIGAVAEGGLLAKAAADNLFLDDKPINGNNKATPQHLERLDKQLQKIERDPQSLMDLNNDFAEFMPIHGSALNTTAMQAISYLTQKRPYPKQNMPMDTVIQPNKAQLTDYYRTLEIAENPLVVVNKIKNGSLKSKDLVDFRSMYPTLYEDLTKKIMSSYADHIQKGGKVAYQVKKGLSLFSLSPLDTCLTPQAIQSAQAVFAKNNVPQQQQMPAMAPKSSRKSQAPEMAQTDSQRRMANR
jgi:hypothetical protein